MFANGRGREAEGHAQITLFGVRIRTSFSEWIWMAALRPAARTLHVSDGAVKCEGSSL